MNEFLVRLPEPLVRRGASNNGIAVLRSDGVMVNLPQVLRFAQDLARARERESGRLLPPNLRYCGMGKTSFAPGEVIALDWETQGLLGGKGGFGAGLRDMGKRKGKNQPAQTFALCRDLQGNRLGVQNAQAALRQAEESNSALVSEEWLLERPSWAEPVVNKRAQAPVREKAASVKTVKPNAVHAFEAALAQELEVAESNALDAVQAGLEARKRQKLLEQEDDSNKPDHLPPAGVQLVSGDAKVLPKQQADSYIVTGKSDFSTVAFLHIASKQEVELLVLTPGLVQFGYMRPTSFNAGLESELNGVGDVANSFAMDFARELFLVDGTRSTPVANAVLNKNSIVRVFERDGAFHFTADDKPLLQHVLPKEEEDAASPLVPCISLEEEESVQIRFKPLPIATTTTSSTSAASQKEEEDDLDFSSIDALERAGGDRLKQALQARGLKAGGTVAQRAQRLYNATHKW